MKLPDKIVQWVGGGLFSSNQKVMQEAAIIRIRQSQKCIIPNEIRMRVNLLGNTISRSWAFIFNKFKG